MYYAFFPDSIFKSLQPKSSDLDSEPYDILIHCSPNPCKENYLYGNLLLYKIPVNHLWPQMSCLVQRLSQNASCG